MPLKKDLAEFSMIVQAGAASLRNVVNDPELSAWLEAIAAERLGPASPAPKGAELTKESKARDWLDKVARRHQTREGLSAEVRASDGSADPSWGEQVWVRKALAANRPLSRLQLPHEERERIASVLDWMRSPEGPSVSGDWTRISFDQAVKAEHDWIDAKAKAFAKKKQDQEASQGTKLFLDLSGLGAPWSGWRWVKVESAVALDREGALMKHCVGSYAKDVAEGRKEIYSLRDPGGKPKLTAEARGTTLAQLKGFANGECPAELREAVGAFAGEFEKVADPAGLGLVKLSSDMERAGFISLPGLGVFQSELDTSPEQRDRWKRWLSNLVKGQDNEKGHAVECEELVCFLAKTGMARELSELLPILGPEAKHSKALSEAARAGQKGMVEMLLSVSDPLANYSWALRVAANVGHMEIVEMLLPWSDPLAVDSWALCWAARGGHKGIVEMLLPVSDPLAGDSEALIFAAKCGHKEIVEMLLPVSDPLAGDSQALSEAARGGYKEIVKMLLPVSDPLAGDSYALRCAAIGGHKEILEMLMPLSDPAKALDSDTLLWAAIGGHREIVEMLAPYYSENKKTFHRILKTAGMDSIGFIFSTLGVAGTVEPLSGNVAGKIMGRRQKSLPREIAGELPGRPQGT